MAVVIVLNSRISQVLKLVWALEIVDCKEKRIISWCFCCYSRKTFSAIKKEIISRKRKDYYSSQAHLFYTSIKERASPCLPTFCFLKNTSHCTVPPLQWKVNAVAFIWLRGATIQRSPQNAHCTHVNSTRYSLQLLTVNDVQADKLIAHFTVQWELLCINCNDTAARFFPLCK